MEEEARAEKARSILAKLKQNCNMQSTAHASLRDQLGGWSLGLTVSALFVTAALLPLSLVSDSFASEALHLTPDNFRLVNASVVLLAFFLVLLQLAWQPGSRSSAHGQAVKHYSRAKLAIRRLEQRCDVNLGDVELIEESYLDERDLPPIPENQFIRLKKWHAQKLAQSKSIDENLRVDPRRERT